MGGPTYLGTIDCLLQSIRLDTHLADTPKHHDKRSEPASVTRRIWHSTQLACGTFDPSAYLPE